MKPAEKRELIKNLTSIAIFILVVLLFTYGGNFFKPKIDPLVSAEATREMKEQIDCSQKSSNEYLQLSLKLSDKEAELQKSGSSTVEAVLDERRLKERECIQQATCEYISTNKQRNPMAFDAEFNLCLDDYRDESIDPPDPY